MSSTSKSRSKEKLVWKEEHDILLLKGMIDYDLQKQSNPYDDISKFLDFVNSFLPFSVMEITDKLWGLKNRYVKSNYDISKPHHVKLLEFSKLIKCWGCRPNVSLDSDKCGNFVASDGQNVDNVVDDVDSEKVLKVVEDGQNVEQDNVATDDNDDDGGGDDVLEECLEVVKKKRKFASTNGRFKSVRKKRKHLPRNGLRLLRNRLWKLRNRCVRSKHDTSKPHHGKLPELSKSINSWGCRADMSLDSDKCENFVASVGQNLDNVVVDDVDIDKFSKVVVNKGKGRVVSSDDDNCEEDNVAIDDDDVLSEYLKVVNKKRKLVSGVGQNDVEDFVVVEDVDAGKSEQKVKDKNKGNVATSDGQNVEDDNVVVDELGRDGSESVQVVKHRNEENVVISNGQNVKDSIVAVDEFHGDGRSAQVGKDRNKGNVLTIDGQNVEDDTVVVDEFDGDGSKSAQVVKDGNNRNVVISDGQNVDEEHVVVISDDNVVVKGKDTSMYPELTNALELQMLSGMPKNCAMDIINSMGKKKANELEEKWTDFRLMEIQLNAKKMDLSNKQIKMILEATRK